MIIFFDLAAKDGIKTWSPNTWKTRYVLNYKKLPYKTIALEYPDLEDEFKKLGIPPSTTNPLVGGPYTSPSIIDEAANTPVSDSYKIAEYLDKTYPSTPPVIPPGSEALQAAFYDHFWQLMGPIFPLLIPRTPLDILNPRSAEYFTQTRFPRFGKPLDEVEPQGEARVEAWKKVQEAFGTLDKWWGKSAGPFFMGDQITFADIIVASMLQTVRLFVREESVQWKDISKWNNGRWNTLLADLAPYADVEP